MIGRNIFPKGVWFCVEKFVGTYGLLISALLLLLLTGCKSDADRYDRALSLMNEQSYEDASEVFSGILKYKDSREKKQECDNYVLYNAAVQEMKTGNYDLARDKFRELDGFLDSAVLLKESKNNISYSIALAQLKRGDIEKALGSFMTLGDFKDSADKAEECRKLKTYNEALKIMEQGDVETARAAFKALGSFSDSERMLKKCQDLLDDARWEIALQKNNYETFAVFLQNEGGKYYQQALDKCDELFWKAALKSDEPKTYQEYLDNFQQGKYRREAVERLRLAERQDGKGDYDSAMAEDTIVALQAYMAAYPQSSLIGECEKKIEEMRSNPKYYERLLADPSEKAVKGFLNNYPGHANEKDAKRLLDRGRGTLMELRDKGMISVTVTGLSSPSTQKCRLAIQNLTVFSVTVTIPYGTYFESSKPGIENMLSTKKHTITIAAGKAYQADIDTASMNISRGQPGVGDKYAVKRLSKAHTLVKLLQKLDKAPESYSVTQAAVWIIADNPSDGDLANSLEYPNGNKVIKTADIKKARALIKSLS